MSSMKPLMTCLTTTKNLDDLVDPIIINTQLLINPFYSPTLITCANFE